jgi:endonuclease III
MAFDIDAVMERIRVAVEPYPKAALFELAELGFSSPFEQLLACMISTRTLDEVTLHAAQRLFRVARTPEAIDALDAAAIDELITPSTFHTAKAFQFKEIARIVLHEHQGQVPCDFEALTRFHGVGPKCANLVLAIACAQPKVSVDVHVHRITNRWGYVQTNRPHETMAALEGRLPRRYWVDINRLLVPFGKHICTGRRPHCSTCPVHEMCAQAGVIDPR